MKSICENAISGANGQPHDANWLCKWPFLSKVTHNSLASDILITRSCPFPAFLNPMYHVCETHSLIFISEYR